jgi:hypothetical protein
MPVLQIKGFSGTVPVKGDRAIPDNFAVQSVNTWLYGDELRGIRPPVDQIAVQTATRKVFRIPKRTVGGDPTYPGNVPPPSYLGDSVWVQFTDPDTDILKGQLVEDKFERYYFCSPTTGPVFNTYDRLLAGLPMYWVGVPAVPGTAAFQVAISVTGGVAPVTTRAYTYTWVNIYGEESAPALPTTAAGNSNGTWAISGIDDPTTEFTNYGTFSKKRLYRTITGTSGQTTYYRVAEIASGVTTYSDTMTDAVLAGNLKLESSSWQPPPRSLQGWIAMPNGFLIGFDKQEKDKSSGNNIYMSETYHWHAWPPEYKQASETPVVGLGVLGQTCVVCTQGYPATITGSKPATCSFTKSTSGDPCMSRGSIVSTPTGIIYASQNGLQLVGPEGIQNVTEQIITRDEWGRSYAPQYIRAVRHQEGYLALRMWPSPTPRTGFYIDPTDLKVALTELSDFGSCVNLDRDFWSGETFWLSAGMVKRWDPPTDDLMPVQWRSKEFQFQYQENFGAYSIYWDDTRYSNAAWGAGVLPTTEHVHFIVYADRKIVYNQPVPRNGRPVRLPSGFKADIWQFEIKARAPVYSLHVASTMKELKTV